MITVECGSKYDKNVNQPGKPGVDYPKDQPFRTRKVNLVWEKAQKVSDIKSTRPLFQCLHFTNSILLHYVSVIIVICNFPPHCSC